MMDTIDIDIVCPLYNASKYIEALYNGIKKQKNVNIKGIHFFLTESIDNSKEILDNLGLEYELIKKEEFSHSKIRNSGIRKSFSNSVILISQDVNLFDEFAFFNLAKKLLVKDCAFAYGRQIVKKKHLEKYIRLFNYSKEGYIFKKKDIEEKQIKAFFASDAFSIVNKGIFVKLNGYDNKDLNINEDMYYAYKVLTNDYALIYASDAIVEHYHDLSLKQIYRRYKEVGIFFRDNKMFDEYKKNSSGLRLAFFVLCKALKDLNIKAIFLFFPNMLARYLGMRKGRKNK